MFETLTSLTELIDVGVRDEEVWTAGIRLRTLAVEEAKKQIAELSLPRELSLAANGARLGPDPKVPVGYADMGSEGAWSINARCVYPKKVNVFLPIITCVKRLDTAFSELLIISGHEDGLEVWMREIAPSANESLKLKLAAWVEARIAWTLDRMNESLRGG